MIVFFIHNVMSCMIGTFLIIICKVFKIIIVDIAELLELRKKRNRDMQRVWNSKVLRIILPTQGLGKSSQNMFSWQESRRKRSKQLPRKSFQLQPSV